MMFLDNTEVLAISGMQLRVMNKEHNSTIIIVSISCVTALILDTYTGMMPGQYILAAVLINIINSLTAASMLNPIGVLAEGGTIEKVGTETDSDRRGLLFGLLGDSISGTGELILIIITNVVAFVALITLIDAILALF